MRGREQKVKEGKKIGSGKVKREREREFGLRSFEEASANFLVR
jgi:hypothetical protein